VLWQQVSPAAPFAFGAALALAAFIALQFVPDAKVAQAS